MMDAFSVKKVPLNVQTGPIELEGIEFPLPGKHFSIQK
jgi:hypothetical protein